MEELNLPQRMFDHCPTGHLALPGADAQSSDSAHVNNSGSPNPAQSVLQGEWPNAPPVGQSQQMDYIVNQGTRSAHRESCPKFRGVVPRFSSRPLTARSSSIQTHQILRLPVSMCLLGLIARPIVELRMRLIRHCNRPLRMRWMAPTSSLAVDVGIVGPGRSRSSDYVRAQS